MTLLGYDWLVRCHPPPPPNAGHFRDMNPETSIAALEEYGPIW